MDMDREEVRQELCCCGNVFSQQDHGTTCLFIYSHRWANNTHRLLNTTDVLTKGLVIYSSCLPVSDMIPQQTLGHKVSYILWLMVSFTQPSVIRCVFVHSSLCLDQAQTQTTKRNESEYLSEVGNKNQTKAPSLSNNSQVTEGFNS